MPADADNPFEVLRLDPTATEEEIVHQAGRLRQRAADEAALGAVRRAVQALTGRADDRLLYALLTHPRPGHAAPALDRFAAAFRRPPASNAPCPVFDLAEFQALLRVHLAAELATAPPAFEPVTAPPDPAELDRLADEACWQGLLANPGA